MELCDWLSYNGQQKALANYHVKCHGRFLCSFLRTMNIQHGKFMHLSMYTPWGWEGGSAGKGWGFDKFYNFLIKFLRVGNERSIKSVKKAPTTGEKI